MRKVISIILLTFAIASNAQLDFLQYQKKHRNVITAVNNKEDKILNTLKKNNIIINELNILFTAYKDEKRVVLYAKKKTDSTYKEIASYKICHSSGDLGPKRRIGDNQVPEGFYHVSGFNPKSLYHLSFGINYPNKSDKLKSTAKNLGGNIAIHGSCVTIGCIPVTDDKIEELYFYAINAKNNGQKEIPFYIFPFEMTDRKFKDHKTNLKPDLINFWNTLKTGFDIFEKERKELNITINKTGDYIIQ